MSYEKVKEYFEHVGLGERVVKHEQVSATVEQAVQAIGCTTERIVKTLSFLVDEEPIIVAVAGDAKIHNAKFKACFHQKAIMIPSDQVEILIGHAPGAVCPFAIHENVKVYLDVSLKRFDTIYTAGGDLYSHVQATLEELENHSKSKGWVDVCKDWYINE